MIKLKSLLTERIDFHDTASEIIKAYKLKSKINFGRGKNQGDYDWVKDVINLRPSYSSVKEFLITVLHEVHHALQRKKFGAKKYEKLYQRYGDEAENRGKDFHDDNKFEEDAERWARKEVSKWIKKYN